MQHLTGSALVRGLVALVLGAFVAVVGTVMHRAVVPWGLVLGLALVLCAAVATRAWDGWVTFVGYAAGVLLVVPVLAQSGPGGDVLVPAGDSLGLWWIIGSAVAIGVAAFAPRSLFDDEPRAPRRRRGRAEPSASTPDEQ
ncbi:DUF6113 family protein [Cellulomonas sp. P22]|uniref:DUF6113 family protein n=1 Tax=Cellulomonas sp. P22 TaxID=3373189 RepID=UPI00379FBDF5